MIVEKISSFLGHYDIINDPDKDGDGKGTLQRFVEASATEFDEEIVELAETLYPLVFDAYTANASYISYLELNVGNDSLYPSTDIAIRRAVQHYILRYWQVKGTKIFIDALLKLIGFYSTITEYFDTYGFDSPITLDDDTRRLDSTCIACSDYEVSVVRIDGSGTALSQAELDGILSVITTNEPINAHRVGDLNVVLETDLAVPIFSWNAAPSLTNSVTGTYTLTGLGKAWNNATLVPFTARTFTLNFTIEGSSFEAVFDYSSNISNLATAPPLSTTSVSITRQDGSSVLVDWDDLKSYITGSVTNGAVTFSLKKVDFHTNSIFKIYGLNAAEIDIEGYFSNVAGTGSSDTETFQIIGTYDATHTLATLNFVPATTTRTLTHTTFNLNYALVIDWGDGQYDYYFSTAAGSVALSNVYGAAASYDVAVLGEPLGWGAFTYTSVGLSGSLDISGFGYLRGNNNAASNAALTELITGSSTETISAFVFNNCSIANAVDISNYPNMGGSIRFSNNDIPSISIGTKNSSFTFFDFPNNPITTAPDFSGYSAIMNANNTRIDLSKASITSATEIDNLFILLDAKIPYGYTSRLIDVSGGTNAAPTATSLAARTSLIAKGITVLTN